MIGKTISHYKILEKIGEGGMGEVYLAEDSKLKRKVALKFLPKEYTKDKDARERFFIEAQAAAALNHPNIVTIHEINEFEDQTYIAMEYVEGNTLKDKIASGPLPLAEALEITSQICEGLKKAHEAGIVHRDIKPQNIIINKDRKVKILDFGLVKLAGQAQMTKIGTTLGTVSYMSPEQAKGENVDHKTDIWSLGVILYEMITGQLPFRGDYDQAVIYSILNEEPEPVTANRAEVPQELERIINKALVKDPSGRYQHADDLLVSLRNIHKKSKKDIDKLKNSRKILTIGLLVLTLIFISAVGYILLNKSEGTAGVIDSIAVLPLENLSGDPNQEYFSEGMTEALITELSRIKALKVISRTSVMQFKNTQKSLPEIARQLKVAAVVEGSVLKAGDKVRITAQLIEAESDKHLWAESYERDLRDILSLQKEVAKTIAKQIKITLTPAEKDTLSKGPSIDPVAHEAYLKGHYFLNQITVKGARKAIEFFNRVIELEPEFAPAYAGIANAYDTIVSFNAIPSKQGWGKVRVWAEKALKIDKNNSDAIMLIADVKFLLEWDWPGAEQAYEKSIKSNPNNATAYNWYGTFLSSMGRNFEAIPMSKKAIELAPLSIAPYLNAIGIHLLAGLDKQAAVLLNKVKELFPQHPILFGVEGWICLTKFKYQEALQLFQSQLTKELSPAMKDLVRTRIAFVLARTGKEMKAREMLAYLIDRYHTHNVSPFQIALIYHALEKNDEAFVWLEKAYNDRDDDLPHLVKVSPLLDKLRQDPRFKDLLKRMKLDK